MSVSDVQANLPNPVGIGRHDIAGRGKIVIQPRASAVFQNGSACVHRDGVSLAEVPLSASPRTDLVSLGRYEGESTFTASSTADSSGGALNTDGSRQSITLTPWSDVGTGWFATGKTTNQILEANVDQPCFWYDDDTLYLTDLAGTLSFAGFVAAIEPTTGRVAVKNSEIIRSLYILLSAGETPGPAITSDDSVSYVMTNLPAGAFVAGVWTATATGALNTTQDGLTVAPAVGDKVIFPPGTITTQVVTAAQSGPYECVVAGATGVKAVYQRTARFAHGAIITPGTKVKVTLGGGTTFSGTTWRCDPTTAIKVVDTDDPVMFPERVVVQKTCGSGTATIATVPLRAAGKFSVTCDFNGGTPAATATTIQASTQTPGAIGTASIVIQEQSVLGTAPGTGTATCAVTITQ